MYRVAIIDDEPVIVDGLTRAVDWEKKGCTVIGSAYDGIEGLELIRREKPHIIITDISMPNLDGLKMIAALRSEFPYMQISILTGFRDFDFAREAISLGVMRYILKPSKFDELDEAISAMTGRLDELAKKYPDEFPEEPQDEAGRSASNFIINKAMEYLRAHYSEKLRLEDVAAEIYVSQWHLSKLINRHTGSNFSELLNGIRVEKAKELLANPALRICDVAEQVGFMDLTHFSRVFKRIEGISANEYRNKL